MEINVKRFLSSTLEFIKFLTIEIEQRIRRKRHSKEERLINIREYSRNIEISSGQVRFSEINEFPGERERDRGESSQWQTAIVIYPL